MLEEDETEAAREARDCGAIESTTVRCCGEETGGFDASTLRTSSCDWSVMRTDSAEVMHPLQFTKRFSLDETLSGLS